MHPVKDLGDEMSLFIVNKGNLKIVEPVGSYQDVLHLEGWVILETGMRYSQIVGVTRHMQIVLH